MSKTALYYAGGLLKHARALCAICNPTTNSYKRLVPGYEAPVNLAYSSRNRSAAIRIPTYSENPKAKRLEYRPPDPAANPYLAFAALLLAGLDGVLQGTGAGWKLAPSVFVDCRVPRGQDRDGGLSVVLFCCPACGGELAQGSDSLDCGVCDRRWAVRAGLYDFKEPLAG